MITAVSRHFVARGQRAFGDLDGCLAMIKTAVLVTALLMVSSGAALAHSFTAALLVVGEDREDAQRRQRRERGIAPAIASRCAEHGDKVAHRSAGADIAPHAAASKKCHAGQIGPSRALRQPFYPNAA